MLTNFKTDNNYRRKSLINYFISIFIIVLFFSVIESNCDAQVNSNVRSKEINLLIGDEVLEIIQLIDEDEVELDDNKEINISADNNKVELRNLNQSITDAILNNGSIITRTDDGGKVKFFLKAVDNGREQITFTDQGSVIAGTSTAEPIELDNVELRVNVIDVEAKFTSQVETNTGQRDDPLVYEFEDISEGNVTFRKWNFGDPASLLRNTIEGSGNIKVVHEFTKPGIYNVTLEITADVGRISDNTIGEIVNVGSSSVCVESGDGTGSGTIHGFVFKDDPHFLLDGASVILTGPNLTRLKRSNLNGAYRFRNVTPGKYSITACLPNHECQNHTGTLDGGDTETVDFVLTEVDHNNN